jgi:adenine/guanine phosphoribosyltransferase-like PRPP-binding protein
LRTSALRSSRDRLLGAVKTIQNARRVGEATYLTDGIYRDGQLFRFACSDLNERYARRRIDLVVAYDSTALPLAAPLAYFVGTGLAVLQPSARGPILDLQSIPEGCRTLLVADLLDRGTQLASGVALLRQGKGELVEIVTLLEVVASEGAKTLSPVPTYSVCKIT